MSGPAAVAARTGWEAPVRFDLTRRIDAPADTVWRVLTDWAGHEDWVPATRVEVGPGDPTAPGATFTAYTGVRPLVLEDRMRVVSCAWDESARSGSCVVEKVGPVLSGQARFRVETDGPGCVVQWSEDVRLAGLPAWLGGLAAAAGKVGFLLALRRLAAQCAEAPTHP